MHEVADPSLELARALRMAVRKRDERLARVLPGYDSATSPEDRWGSAASFMFAIDEIDAEYAERKRRAVREFEKRQAGAA
jgi:hypothetical protein